MEVTQAPKDSLPKKISLVEKCFHFDPAEANVCFAPDETVSREPIEVEFQSCRQPAPPSRIERVEPPRVYRRLQLLRGWSLRPGLPEGPTPERMEP